MIVSPAPVLVVACVRSPDVLLLPGHWPVRLSPAERRELAAQLLAYDQEPEHE